MLDINQTITTNFQENIAYLQKEQPALFTKLSALDSAIANGHYEEKYELVYENNGFDVFEKSSQNYLYAKESLAHSIISANSVNYKTDDNLFEGFVRHNFSEDDLQNYKSEEPFTNYLSDIAPIIHYTQENRTNDKKLKTIDKFIFFGAGLGLHIEAIHKKINSKIYLIVEDDLELFRLSLFAINYKKIAQEATLIFSVFENQDEFMSSSALFLEAKYESNHYLKYFHLLSHSDEKQNQFQIAITSQPHIRFHFNNLMKQYLQPLEYLFSDYKFLNSSLSFEGSDFKDMPFLLLAMGPSLQNNIKWLKENHKKFITIAVSSSLSYLEQENISPNIIIHIDPFEWGIVSFDKLKSKEFLKDSLCLFSAATPPNIISIIDKEKLFFFESGTNYKKASLKVSSPCVGSLAYQLLLRLKTKYTYLLGLDLAVDVKTGKTHSANHQSLQQLQYDDEASNILYKKTLFKVAGNLTEIVQTTPNFYASIFTIEYVTKMLKDKSQNIVNLSNGAKFSQTMSATTESLKLKDIDIDTHITAKLEKLCLKNSQDKLSNEELKSFKERLKHAKSLQNFIQNNKKDKLLSIEVSIEDIKKYELSRLLDTYLHYILSYVYDFFNSDNITEYSVHLENINGLLQEHLLKIINHYIDSLENRLN